MPNGVRGLLALVLVLAGFALIAVIDRPAYDVLGILTEIVAGVLFGINFVRTAKQP